MPLCSPTSLTQPSSTSLSLSSLPTDTSQPIPSHLHPSPESISPCRHPRLLSTVYRELGSRAHGKRARIWSVPVSYRHMWSQQQFSSTHGCMWSASHSLDPGHLLLFLYNSWSLLFSEPCLSWVSTPFLWLSQTSVHLCLPQDIWYECVLSCLSPSHPHCQELCIRTPGGVISSAFTPHNLRTDKGW